MKVYLTSSPTIMDWNVTPPKCVSFNAANGFLEHLKNDWKKNSKCLLVSSDPDNIRMMEEMKAGFMELFPANGLTIAAMDVCHNESVITSKTIVSYDVIILSGGHVPTQNAFFQKIGLQDMLKDFSGIVIGISAGSMNSADTVYAQPELEGESEDPAYQRFLNGLGLTAVQIIPHWQYIKDQTLDGKRVLEDITLPDSKGNKFYALADGSYLEIEDDTTTLYGEAYLVENGQITQICKENEYKEIAEANANDTSVTKDVYELCPEFENEQYQIRLLSEKDAADLLNVYSDEKAVSLCNSDNCSGGFHFTTIDVMRDVIKWWLEEYTNRGFVRFSIVDKHINKVIGTIELFHRDADDYFTNCGLLRLDIKSDYEKSDIIESILSLIVSKSFPLFDCDKIATKVKAEAIERRNALSKMGFSLSEEKLIGHDGTEYGDYYVIYRDSVVTVHTQCQ